eukprot:TRINITY_DN12363_c0_g1_i2.p1 TRINITY_DN12363_c0_g1~~TRINITY_DN12363_c0_g1_i2.p1  ORF type:complete len:468 (+),score=94.06 TRINITY_DN12363_c0_g1_i2:1-1404(+)
MAEKTEVTRLTDDLENLKKQQNSIESQYVQKEVFDNYKNVEIPQQFNQINSQIEDTNGEIDQLKAQISQLYDLLNKMNSSDTKTPIEIPQIQPVQNLDTGKIKALETKLKNLENKLLQLQQLLNEKQGKADAKETSDNLQKLLGEKLNRNEFNINPLQELLKIMQENLEQAKKYVKKNANDIISLTEKISNQKPVIQEKIIEKQQQQPIPTVDEDQLKTYFQNELNSLKDSLLKMLKELQKKVDQKADKAELQALDEEFRDLLNSLMNELKKFVTKADLRKVVASLEAKIRELQIMILGEKDKSLDGLFVKRPLAWSCASCDHNLDKFKGKIGDSVNWAVFPPKETSPLRMGKYAMHYASEIAQKKLDIIEGAKGMGKTDSSFFPSSGRQQGNQQQQQYSQQQQQQMISTTTTAQFNQQSSTGLKVVSKTAMPCLLYTSDAADEEDSVDLSGCSLNKKNKKRDTKKN